MDEQHSNRLVRFMSINRFKAVVLNLNLVKGESLEITSWNQWMNDLLNIQRENSLVGKQLQLECRRKPGRQPVRHMEQQHCTQSTEELLK